MKPPKNKRLGRAFLLLSILLIILALGLSYPLVFNHETEVIPQKTVEIPEESIIEEAPLEAVVPDETTEFFSKEQGKALLYYSVVNDSVRFFKTEGIDPVTGEALLPVTEEIVAQYKESITPKEELAIVDTRNYKVNEIKIVKKKKEPLVEKKIIRESMWNTQLINSNQKDEISLFVFNEQEQIDSLLLKRFKKEFDNKNYFVTPTIIHWDMLTPKIVDRIKNSDINYFDGNLKKYTDYVCVGIASYAYGENAYRNDLTDCTLRIDYFIYDAGSGQHLFTEKDKVIGSGQTKKLARQDAVGKFIL